MAGPHTGGTRWLAAGPYAERAHASAWIGLPWWKHRPARFDVGRARRYNSAQWLTAVPSDAQVAGAGAQPKFAS